jgi:diketogulonate reductase-like aldo/keto reductase
MTEATKVPAATLPGGLAMPMIGFGTWQATDSQGYEATRFALETGYRHIDTATMYGNQREVGRAVRDSGVPREDIFITTKLPPARAGREPATLDESLAELGTDHVDLWLIHWPPADRAGVATWREFIAARDAGRARAIGVSNYSTAQIDELIRETGVAPAVNQIPWSPALHDEKVLADSRERGVTVEGYSPFRRSDLRDPVLVEVAQAHGVTPAQVVLRWHIQHGVIVIPKSVTPERIAANLDIFGFSLTDQELARIDGLGR